MKIVAVVPVKLNNQRLPQKNTKSFSNGRPLCYYILSTLLKVQEIQDIYVYCSSENITDFLPHGIKYLKRSQELDRDETRINEVICSFAEDVQADVYVMAHVTAPFIESKNISKGLHAVLSKKYDSAFSVKKIQDFLWQGGKPLNYEMNHIPRTQDLEPIYQETSGFYIYTNQVINKYGQRIGRYPYLVEVGEIEAVDIDEEEDFLIADAIYNYKLQNNERGINE